MKLIRSFALLVSALMLIVAAPVAIAAGDAPGSYEEALAQAASSGKPLVLDFYTEW